VSTLAVSPCPESGLSWELLAAGGTRWTGPASDYQARPPAARRTACYALIHLPLADQQALFPRLRDWLRPGGYLLAIVGAEPWTGTEPYLGAPMFWDVAGTADYLRWLAAARLTPLWHRFIPEGTSGHTLILARAS
jgi:hypothetical protein